MSSSQKSSAPSASRPAIKRGDRSAAPNERIRQSEDRLSPAAGSATDRASDHPSAGMPGSSSRSTGPVRIDPPPKRTKVSAKSVVKPVGAEKTPTALKKTKPVHVFTSSRSRLEGTLGKIRSFAASGEGLELLVPLPNERPWDCPPGSFKLAPQKQSGVDRMRRLADFRGLFDDEREEEFLAEEEAEGRETDEDGGSPLIQAGSPQTLGGSLPPPTGDPPLPAGSPSADVAPPPPAKVPTEGVRVSVDAMQTAEVKRTREETRESLTELPQATRLRTEGSSVESRAGPDEQGVGVDQVAGFGSEEAGWSVLDADPSQADEEGEKSPLVEE
ncbi:unnamed protein product [Cochlearia groenlandica]